MLFNDLLSHARGESFYSFHDVIIIYGESFSEFGRKQQINFKHLLENLSKEDITRAIFHSLSVPAEV